MARDEMSDQWPIGAEIELPETVEQVLVALGDALVLLKMLGPAWQVKALDPEARRLDALMQGPTIGTVP